MANTPRRSIRVDDETWEQFGEVCEEDQMTRTAALVSFMRYRIAGSRAAARLQKGSTEE